MQRASTGPPKASRNSPSLTIGKTKNVTQTGRSSASVGTKPRHVAPGLAPACLPKPNGSERRADLRAPSILGATSRRSITRAPTMMASPEAQRPLVFIQPEIAWKEYATYWVTYMNGAATGTAHIAPADKTTPLVRRPENSEQRAGVAGTTIPGTSASRTALGAGQPTDTAILGSVVPGTRSARIPAIRPPFRVGMAAHRAAHLPITVCTHRHKQKVTENCVPAR